MSSDEIDVENGVSFLEQCILDIMEKYPDCALLLCGDFNSRTANKNGNGVDAMDINYDVFNKTDISTSVGNRQSKDTALNEFGEYLLTVCCEFDLSILNGMY